MVNATESSHEVRSGYVALGAAVAVVEPDDVVEVRRRDLEDRRVLERGDAMHGAGPVAEGSLPAPISSVSSSPPTCPSSSEARPLWTSQDSSFCSWYWRLSA